MRGIAIIFLIVIFFWVFWPPISRWLKRKAMMKAEDYLRSSMGMPPRNDRKRQTSKNQRGYHSGEEKYGSHSQYPNKEPIIPKEYAEDVEFVETIDYSETTHFETSKDKEKFYHESQISDAEWTEIKTSHDK